MSIIKIFPELKSYNIEDYKRLKFDKPVLMIAMTARTGSTHLCSALSSVIDAPVPNEILNPRGNIQCLMQQRNVANFYDYIKSLSNETDERLIFKTSWSDFSCLKNVYQYLFPDLDILYLNRLDIDKQAVSLYKAKLSGVWHDTAAGANKTSNGKYLEEFNVKELYICIKQLEKEKKEWETFFLSEGISPARVNYEDFECDLESTIDYIFQYFNFEKQKDLVVSDYNKLSDETSDKWIKALKENRLDS